MEYRKSIELDPESSYSYAEMGPIPGLPPWHEQSHPSRFPSPSKEAALRFAKWHKAKDPGREVEVSTPDGERITL